MNQLRLASAALNQTPLAWDSNLANIVAALDAARASEVSLLCLPELCISGYGCEDAFFAHGVQQTSLDILAEILPATKGLAVALGLPLVVEEQLFNACAFVCNGLLIGFVAKQCLAGDGIHYEPRWFKPWPAGKVGEVTCFGESFSVGDVMFDCGGVKIGMEVCRDAWVVERTGKRLAARGADVILNPSGSHFAFAKQEIRRDIVLRGSRDFHVSYAYTNLLGNEAGNVVYDGGTLIATRGELVAVGPRFSFADYILVHADVDVDATRADRAEANLPIIELDGATLDCGFQLPSATKTIAPTQPSPWDTSPPSKEEEFARAVSLGLFDYLRKSRAGGLVISLSGGADSATVATMVWLMTKFGVAELGYEGLARKLAQIPQLAEASSAEEIVGALLTCVYQATRNSGETTLKAACTIASAIGANFLEWNIDAMVDGYVDTVSKAIGRSITWKGDDTALQNIQARARAPGAWLLANLSGSLLLTTSNRSEAAVGYATMDGDTAGGLAPIAGIDKAYLLEWLKWMERTGPEGIGPLPELAVINAQTPTAELRPVSESQTDEGDLMPYRVLDAVERAAIRDKLMPVEVFQAVQDRFPEYSKEQLGIWIERFFRLWCRNQWKRERYAPSFHLDDENLDPKSWCRFPILSGGFERELAELRELLTDG
ncbi:NAD(+) synthase [Bythopirellula polymerisocia]|uniref:Glutamine-dependent NAD(+) synthetase n=1 Tax=Bythopirellula polymerisocia TaxID=2528003 RepID=A0A5C6CT85_9BACT|nr:NAD(+) synthase [Bythopirellula polymerisocia]TWU28153.1 Glutamine-dependent NAD(+) synthetase [Bythopirellula polymerisocia]